MTILQDNNILSIISIESLYQQQLLVNDNDSVVGKNKIVRRRRRTTNTTAAILSTSSSSLLVLLILIYCGCFFTISIIPSSTTILIDAFIAGPVVFIPRQRISSSSSSTLQATQQVTSSIDTNNHQGSKLSSMMKGIDTTKATLKASMQLPTTSLSKSRTTTTTGTTSTSPKKQQLQQQQHVKRLSVEEQQELFRHIMEVRRIRNIEMELLNLYEQQQQQQQEDQLIIEPILLQPNQKLSTSSSSSSSTTTSQISSSTTPKISTLQLAQSTGYGNNINEFNTALILGQQAREQLITTNIGLIHYCIHDILQYHTLRTITIDDLIQEGAIGLSRAVDKYNPSFYHNQQQQSSSSSSTSSSAITTTPSSSSSSVLNNAKFSTYAVYWIRAAILRTIRERDDIMRVPDHVTTAIKKISNVAQSFGVSLDNTSNDDVPTSLNTSSSDGSKNREGDDDIETPVSLSSTYSLDNNNNNMDPDQYYQHENIKQMIVDKTGYTDQMVQNAMLVRNRRNKYGTTVLSFESWMQQGKNYETDMQLVSPTIQNDNYDISSSYYFDEPTNQNGSIEHMKQILSRFLRPKEMEALSWRYGLNDLQEQQQNNNNNTPKTNSNPLAKRNYLAETEMELYGSTTTTTATSSKTRNISVLSTPTNKQKDDIIVKGKWGEAMSFHEVGKQMQISAEYGRRLCHGALNKLRNAVAEGRLEPAILL